MTKEQLKTGTTTIGLVCKDGIVLASDMRGTAGSMIVNKHVKKIHPINEDMAVTWAGSVSDLQLLTKLIRAEVKLKTIQTKKKVTVKEAANLIGGLLYGTLRQMSMFPSIAHFLLAGSDNSGLHLYDLFPDGSITETDDFVSSGSGSVFAYGVLESEYKKGMTLEQGIELAAKCVRTALERDTGSGGGVFVVTVTDKGVQEKVFKKIKNQLE
ncbi:proteasome subunit beta [Candidatus Woesearchaeota archaeon]|nr:proteasome subunit beta [Candidatus Woesearchaeota archaeon]MBW3017149.1 proteasome subunit beta [Candidatus Woesearchaeota archaeon]